ncbi:hypothetical protein [Serratia fonticola]|uniref:hypothetical protein n=1 Tax=Serratia fonticola TaxID=47917 RepID=UPI0027FFFDA3|nr:hypothetical protein [Serratia fonticola]MDQ7207436.1 hypothetical protein [Serratia fonticola]HBE9077671.1 hypothetical protein [Serratia fonticola]HBE9088242.1 hypothetical protein [Serratia fonticola]HBE9150400.1 hypothetical protein [Serratia fonticola]
MPVSSIDIHNFAKDCIDRKDEIGYRNAIARTYYSAYHLVSPLMKNGPKENHQGLIDYIKGDAARGCEKYERKYLIAISYILQALKDQRIISDYRLEEIVDELQAKAAVATTEKLVVKCGEMTRDSAASA